MNTLNQHFLFDQNFLWDSCIWGAIAGGYCIYGRKKRFMLKAGKRRLESSSCENGTAAAYWLPMSDDTLISQLGKLDQHALWASCLWGAVASGYWIYGMKQKLLVPFLGGAAMMAVSFLMGALTMSLASVAIIFVVWWLLRQGY